MPHTALPKRSVFKAGTKQKTGRFEAGKRSVKKVRQTRAILKLHKT